MTLNEFITEYNGKPGIGDTPANEGECVGLVLTWTDSLGLPHIWGNADDLLANADRSAYDVTLNARDNFPKPGDIICWGAGWAGSPVGHTAIVVNADVNAFEVFEQNDRLGGGDGRCRLYSFTTYEGVQGWIHPKVLDNQSNQGNEDVLNNPDDVRDMYRFMLGREATDSEAQSWVGQSWHDAYYQIRDSAEGQAYRNNTAKRVGSLAAQIQSQQVVIDALNGQLASLPKTAVSTPAQTVPAVVGPVQPTEVNSTSSNTPINTTDSKPEPAKEATKESTRVVVLGAISFGVTYALENVLPGLPKNELALALTVVLKGVDAYIHKNPSIQAKGLLPF